MSELGTAINCQNSENEILSVNGSGQFGHSLNFAFDLSPAEREIILQERIAIMTIDGGLTEAEAEAEMIASGFYAEAIRRCTADKGGLRPPIP